MKVKEKEPHTDMRFYKGTAAIAVSRTAQDATASFHLMFTEEYDSRRTE